MEVSSEGYNPEGHHKRIKEQLRDTETWKVSARLKVLQSGVEREFIRSKIWKEKARFDKIPKSNFLIIEGNGPRIEKSPCMMYKNKSP